MLNFDSEFDGHGGSDVTCKQTLIDETHYVHNKTFADTQPF